MIIQRRESAGIHLALDVREQIQATSSLPPGKSPQ